MLIHSIFEDVIDGGPLSGIPALVIMVQGCNLNCEWCDSKLTISEDEGTLVSSDEIVKKINMSRLDYVLWTGGEPALQMDAIVEILHRTKGHKHCIETNGTIEFKAYNFHTVVVSPKDGTEITLPPGWNVHVNVTTNLQTVGVDYIDYAQSLTPLMNLFGDLFKDYNELIRNEVRDYCIEYKKDYTQRSLEHTVGKYNYIGGGYSEIRGGES